MIPILFESTEKNFTTNGLGRLSDAVTCVVEEVRNGKYDLEMQYPVNGIHFSDIVEERIIYADHDNMKDAQPFRIVEITKPLRGIVNIYAVHISYDLRNEVLMPVNVDSCAMALAAFKNNTASGSNPFTFVANTTATGKFKTEEPKVLRSVLGGVEGSILDVYGGEWEFDKFTCKLHANRGLNRGVTIRYGKNLTGLKCKSSTESVVTALVPFWKGSDDVVVGSLCRSGHTDDYTNMKIGTLDCSSEFENKPTVAQLNAKATAYMNSNETWSPSVSLDVNFVMLSQTEEYKDFVKLQDVRLCDTVGVYHPEMGVEATAKVTGIKYNVLEDKYENVTLGAHTASLADAVAGNMRADLEKIKNSVVTKEWTEDAIKSATNLITGGLGGTVFINSDADGKPEEIVIIGDGKDIDTARNVWRWNAAGLGFSSNGYDGPYRTAITNDGKIVADFIAAGTLSASLIGAGTLSAEYISGGVLVLGGNGNEKGAFRILDKNGKKKAVGTSNGITMYGNNENDYVQMRDYQEKVKTINATPRAYDVYTEKTINATGLYIASKETESRGKSAFAIGADNTEKISTGDGYANKTYLHGDNTAVQIDSMSGVGQATLEMTPTTNGKLDLSVGNSKNYIRSRLGVSGGAIAYRLYGVVSGDNQNGATWQTAHGELFSITSKYVNPEITATATCATFVANKTMKSPKFATTSDRRLKEDIIDIPRKSAEELVDGLRPVAFRFIGQDKKTLGFIAQEVQELVSDELGIVSADDDGYLSISYEEFVPVLVSTVQAQKKRIDDLEKRLERLEGILNAD